MAQSVSFIKEGLSVAKMGTLLSENNTVHFEPIDKLVSNKKVVYNKEGIYLYYYAKSDSLFMPQVGVIDNIIIATDKKGIIEGIFLYLGKTAINIEQAITKTFDNPKLKSTSFIGKDTLNNKLFWATNDISIFLKNRPDKDYYEVNIERLSGDTISPHIFFIDEE